MCRGLACTEGHTQSTAFEGFATKHACTPVIVGGGKSAIDSAVAAAKGVSSTLVCRSWHWPVPRLLLNAVPFKYGSYSRFGHWMLQPYYAEGPVASWFHGTCAPVKWIWWRVVELMFRGQFHIPSNMVPQDGGVSENGLIAICSCNFNKENE